MIRVSIILSFLITGMNTFAQEAQKKNPYDVNYKVRTDQEAHYPEGSQKLYEQFFYYLKYSEEAMKAKVEGTVMVSFTVENDGTLSNFSILKGVGYGVDEEVVKALKELKFAPAIQNGLKIRSTLVMSFPVSAT